LLAPSALILSRAKNEVFGFPASSTPPQAGATPKLFVSKSKKEGVSKLSNAIHEETVDVIKKIEASEPFTFEELDALLRASFAPCETMKKTDIFVVYLGNGKWRGECWNEHYVGSGLINDDPRKL
jgi:hypothetical protein